MEGREPILLVVHDSSGHWQFLPGSRVTTEMGVAIHLAHMIDEHPEVHELSDLPPGWAAERTTVGTSWQRFDWPDA